MKWSFLEVFLMIFLFPFSLFYIPIKKKKYKSNNQNVSDDLNIKVNKKLSKNAKQLGSDLVEADYFLACCSECAKYRGRVFSVSGKDKRFPKKPPDYQCDCPGLIYFPFIYGISEPNVNTYLNRSVDIIKFSNRPFRDERTKKEKQDFEMYKKQIVLEKQKEIDRAEYNDLMKILPNDMPKSFAAYRRMKNSNSPGFIKILQLAQQANYKINLHDTK